MTENTKPDPNARQQFNIPAIAVLCCALLIKQPCIYLIKTRVVKEKVLFVRISVCAKPGSKRELRCAGVVFQLFR